MPDRKEVLLKAAYDLLRKAEDTPYVEDIMHMTVVYDDADCDGACLMQYIADELNI